MIRAHLPDDEVFRWFQASYGQTCAGDTLCLTLGELRRVLRGE